MSYIKGIDVLPQELLDLIQNYVDGEYIYIPRKECNRKSFWETTRSKRGTSIRNADIYKKYKEGVSTKVLSEMYYLSLKSIQKIIFEMKRQRITKCVIKHKLKWRIFDSEKYCRLNHRDAW